MQRDPMTSDKLSEVAGSCERATGPDRVINLAIAQIFGVTVWLRNDDDTANYETTHWRYTDSLDAAMSLVPEDHVVQLSDWEDARLREKGPWQAIVLPRGSRGRMQQYTFSNRCDHAATPALALTAACLRAHAAIASSPASFQGGE